MTQEEYRRLDTEIAEKVMGWERIDEPFDINEGDVVGTGVSTYLVVPADFSHRAGERIALVDHWDNGEVCANYDREVELYPLPHYSTDIAAAWQIVETGSIKNFMLYRRTDGTYTVQAGQRFALKVQGETAPLAICLAALKAVV